MGTAELGVLLSAACTLLVGVLAFLAKDLYTKQRECDTKVAQLPDLITSLRLMQANLSELDKEVAIIKASRLGERVERLESKIAGLVSDMRVVRAWVESQSGKFHTHRRASDREREENDNRDAEGKS